MTVDPAIVSAVTLTRRVVLRGMNQAARAAIMHRPRVISTIPVGVAFDLRRCSAERPLPFVDAVVERTFHLMLRDLLH